jgi:hypothetical protein
VLLERVVIGSTLESITYAFLSDSYFLPNMDHTPIFYREVKTRILPSKRADFSWSRLQIAMALSGRLINHKHPNNIRITENQIKISTHGSLHKYDFGHCKIFDTTNLHLENEIKTHHPSSYTVYDDFEVSILGGKHNYLEPKISNDTFAREVHFYISDRVDGANYITDCVVESLLTREELHDFEYSDSMARFAVLRHLDFIGIRGNFMKLYKTGMPKYRKPKVIHQNRVVIKKEQNVYEDSERVKFLNFSMREILNEFSTTGS